MAGFNVTLTLNPAAVEQIVGPGGDVEKAVERAAGRVRDRAKQNLTSAGRVNTGALRNDIKTSRISSSDGIWYEVGSSLPYAILQHEGVRGPVLPRRAKVLRFKPKGSSSYVFARSTKGFKGVPFLADALRSLSVQDYL